MSWNELRHIDYQHTLKIALCGRIFALIVEQFTQQIKDEIAKWGKVIQEANIKQQ